MTFVPCPSTLSVNHPSSHTLSSDIVFLSLVNVYVKIIVANCHLEVISSFIVTDSSSSSLYFIIFTEYIVRIVVSLSGGHMLLLYDCWRIMELISFVLACYYFKCEDFLCHF